MDRKTYERTTEKEFIGRKVKSLYILTNGMGQFPAGTVWIIRAKFNGFWLRSDPCPHCGCQANISRVEPSNVVLLPADPEIKS